MNIKAFFLKNWPHFLAVFIFFMISKLYLSPTMDGMDVNQHDIEQHKGMSKEIADYRERTGEETMWTGTMFGGMPSTQVSLIHEGNWFAQITSGWMRMFGSPVGILFLYMLCFYIGSNLFRINKWVSMVLAIAFAFCTYNIILIVVGHNSKAVAIAYLVPMFGAFYYAMRVNWKLGVALFGIFFAFEVSANHLQITFYGGIALLFFGLFELIHVIRNKNYKQFTFTTLGLIAAIFLGVIVNYGNLKLTSEYADYTKRGGNELTINPDGSQRIDNSTDGGLEKNYIFEYSSGIGESAMIFSPFAKGPGSSYDFQSAELIDQIAEDFPENAEQIVGNSLYWGEQPIFSAPSYVGALLVALAFLALFILKDTIKWSLLAVTLVALLLSWGDNFSSLANFMLENIPYYNKFRAPAMILVLVQITIPLLVGLLATYIIENRAEFKMNKKIAIIVSSAVPVLFLILSFTGLSDNYIRTTEISQEGKAQYAAQVRQSIQGQIAAMTPEQLAENKINPNDPNFIESVVADELKKRDDSLVQTRQMRESIFSSGMLRSFLFSLLGLILIIVLSFTEVKSTIPFIATCLFLIIDVFFISKFYLNGNEDSLMYANWWTDSLEKRYPMATTEAETFILANELKQNPSLKSKIGNAKSKAQAKISDLEASGIAAENIESAYIFSALNQNTNYRVFELSGSAFNDTRCSYFHKSLGGYHAAKLTRIQNLADFHLFNSNNKVFDMMNVKYIVRQGEKGMQTDINETVLGAAWFVQGVQIVKDANEEIQALGNSLAMKNIGKGTFLVNGKAVQNALVNGREKIQYINLGKKDTLDVLLTSQLKANDEVAFVQDVNGKPNLIMAAALNQMTPENTMTAMVSYKIGKEFRPDSLVVINKEVASKLKTKTWNSGGKIKNVSYAPNKLVYKTDNISDGFAVFSEIEYPLWKATIDGKVTDIRRVNYLLRGLEIPKGKHTVVFEIGNEELDSKNTIAMIGSIIIFMGLLGVFFFTKKEKI